MFTVRVLERLPRVTGIAVALILLSGIPLAARIGVLGVEFTQEPVEQPYGIDVGIRDPFGNHIRIVQLKVAS
jgi:hypothetical protein